MAVLKPKTGTSTPTTGDLVDKEMAVDLAAQLLYVRDGGTVKQIGDKLPTGTADQTLRYNGTTLEATSVWKVFSTGIAHLAGSTPTIRLFDTDAIGNTYAQISSNADGDLLLSADHPSEGANTAEIKFLVDGVEEGSIDTSGNLSMNGTISSGPITVVDGTSTGQTPFGSADSLVLDSTSSNGMSFLTGTTAVNYMYFGDTANNGAGRIEYHHSTDTLMFAANSTDTLAVKTNQVSVGMYGVGPQGNTALQVRRGNDPSASYNTNTVAIFERDNDAEVAIGSTAADTGTLSFADPGGRPGSLSYNHSTNAMQFTTNGVADRVVIDSAGAVTVGDLSGTGDRMVTANATGVLSTQAIPGAAPSGTEDQTLRYGVGGVLEATSDFVIDSDGNVGIGGSPTVSFEDFGGHVRTTNTTSSPRFTTLWDTPALVDQELGKVQFNAEDSTNADRAAAKISAEADVTWTATNYSTRMTFHVANSAGTLTEAMRIDSAGNVGIGTSNPSSPLELGANAVAAGFLDMRFTSGATDTARIIFHDGTTIAGQIRYDHSDDSMAFRTVNSERMRIDSSGNVGIGKTPATALDVSGTITATGGDSGDWNTAFGWGDHAGVYLPLASGATTTGKYVVKNNAGFSIPTASDTLTGGIQVRQDTAGADAAISFHVIGDFAAHFGLDGGINDFAVGGWSMGANSHRIHHDGNEFTGDGGNNDIANNHGRTALHYNSATATVTRGTCGLHVFQLWNASKTYTLTGSDWKQGDICRFSVVQDAYTVTVVATRIYMPDGTWDDTVTWTGAGGFTLTKYSVTAGYWMVLP